MVVKTRKQGNSMTVTIPSEFNIPSGMLFEVKMLPSGEILFTPQEKTEVHFASDEEAMEHVDDIFEQYDDVFRALVER